MKLNPWTSISMEEKYAAGQAVLNAHHGFSPLSGFLGGGEEGGYHVTELEREWAAMTSSRLCVSCNSATSGLVMAIKALDIKSGDKIIVSPYSMSAGVAAVLWCGATPVFVDIEDQTYGLDPRAVDAAIDGGADAILATSLFGSRSVLKNLTPGFPVIEDAAQAPYAHPEHSKLADISVWSLNVHKPVQVGEGGLCTTEFEGYAARMRAISNHGEMSLDVGLNKDPGLNLRMTEVIAAMAREQIKKGEAVVAARRALASRFAQAIKGKSDVFVADHDPHHTYYVWAFRVNTQRRDSVVRQLNDAGLPVRAGYTRPLYHLPAFRRYLKGELPVVERVESELVTLEMYAWDLEPHKDEITDLLAAI